MSSRVKKYLQMHRTDWITWINNPSTGFEYQRYTTQQLFQNHGESLDDESLYTFFVEVKAIVNSRQMKTETTSS